MPYLLTKTKVMSGLQCHKKLWFDIHSPIKKDSHLFHIGNRFGEYARTHYGKGENLADVLNPEAAATKTSELILNPNVYSIYEAAFIQANILVRPDILLKKNNFWEMVEIKASTSLKSEHIRDATIQAYVLKSCGLTLKKIKIGHINSSFIYKGDDKYNDLLVEVDITEKVFEEICNVEKWINDILYLTDINSPAPSSTVGNQCTTPYPCNYIERCDNATIKKSEIPISIIPNIGKKLAAHWEEKNVQDLRDLPPETLKNPIHKTIQQCHINNTTWINPEIVKKIRSLSWPRYFMDFETVQQGVPILKDTKPYQAVPFQWSLHIQKSLEDKVNLNDGIGFLEFGNQKSIYDFLKTLLEALGNEGPIFVHNASFEITILKSLIDRDECREFNNKIYSTISRIVDTLKLVREGFYSPAMQGSYSLKDIVKAIPTNVDYTSEQALSGGSEAQIAWFICTDSNIEENEKNRWAARLKQYCAQDTYAMYDLINYLTKALN